MSQLNNQVVEIARAWLGTPYRHQFSKKAAGTDCLGLIRGVWRELYGVEPEQVPAYTPDWSEPQREERLWVAAQAHLIPKPVDDVAPGDVVLMRMRDTAVAKHLGIQASQGEMPTLIHAYTGHGVVESPMSQPWARRVVARFCFPEEVN